MSWDRVVWEGDTRDPKKPDGDLMQLPDGHVYEMGTRHGCSHRDCPASIDYKTKVISVPSRWEFAVEAYQTSVLLRAIVDVRAQEVNARGPWYLWNHLGECLEADYAELGLGIEYK